MHADRAKRNSENSLPILQYTQQMEGRQGKNLHNEVHEYFFGNGGRGKRYTAHDLECGIKDDGVVCKL